MDELVIRALSFASKKHRNQRRNDHEESPYINHPIDVMTILAVEGKIDDPITLAAAALHDTLEDTETTAEELTTYFGEKVTAIVIELTDDQSVSRPERYAQQTSKAPHYSPEARLIRIADKIANTRDAVRSTPPSWSVERLEGHFNQSFNVMALLRQTHNEMETLFDQIYEKAMEIVKKIRQS